MAKNKIVKLLLALAACQIAGAVGSFFTAPKIKTWYAGLQKPSFNPPNWVFGPVWISLFFLMGIALFLVWDKARENKHSKVALIWFFSQMLFNILWSFFFFYLESPFYGFVDIIILWLLILATIISFGRVSVKAAVLLFPYILWVGFAGCLNFFLWWLN